MASPPDEGQHDQQPPLQDEEDMRLLEEFVRGVGDFRPFGQVKTGRQQQVTIMKPARVALRLEGKSHYWVYGAPRLGLALLSAEPLSGRDELIARIRQGLRDSSPPAPDDEAGSTDDGS